MRRFFNGLVLGIVIGAIGYWYVSSKMREHPRLEEQAENSAAAGRASASNAAADFSDSLKARMAALDLDADHIKDELARTGRVIRTNAQNAGAKIADAASDARIVASIKAKYTMDSKLSVWQISVSCKDGHVDLSGMVPTRDDIARAIGLAMGVDGVVDVQSTLQAKSNS